MSNRTLLLGQTSYKKGNARRVNMGVVGSKKMASEEDKDSSEDLNFDKGINDSMINQRSLHQQSLLVEQHTAKNNARGEELSDEHGENSYKTHSNNSPDDISLLQANALAQKQLKWILVSEPSDQNSNGRNG
jgi:hypothetical protein